MIDNFRNNTSSLAMTTELWVIQNTLVSLVKRPSKVCSILKFILLAKLIKDVCRTARSTVTHIGTTNTIKDTEEAFSWLIKNRVFAL